MSTTIKRSALALVIIAIACIAPAISALVPIDDVPIPAAPGDVCIASSAASIEALRCELWVALYDGASGTDTVEGFVMSPDGSRLFVTGVSHDQQTSNDFATCAFDATSGAQLWCQRYNGPANAGDGARSIGISPDGEHVYVLGQVRNVANIDIGIVAYAAGSGEQEWVTLWNGPLNGHDFPVGSGDGSPADALHLSTDGSKVYVAGSVRDPSGVQDIVTMALDAATGAVEWTSYSHSLASLSHVPRGLAVGPDGQVIVAGIIAGESHWTVMLVAYEGSSGAQLWSTNIPAPGTSDVNDIEVTADAIYVTGKSYGLGTDFDYLTAAYDLNGISLWMSYYGGDAWGPDGARAIAVSPDGSRVAVTGFSYGSGTYSDIATVAYDTTDGETDWVARYNGPALPIAQDEAYAVSWSPTGNRLFVVGQTMSVQTETDLTTIAYTPDGSWLWSEHYDAANSAEWGRAVLASPDGATVYTAGYSTQEDTGRDMTILAYSAAAFRIQIPPEL